MRRTIAAFTLLEILIAIAIIAILAALVGPKILDMIKGARNAGGGLRPVPTWQSPAATIPPNTPSTFTLVMKGQKLDSSGVVISTTLMPTNTPVLFDLIVVTGSGSAVSATIDGSPLPQPNTATAGNRIGNLAGSTDANGLIQVVITLAPDSRVQLVAHETPSPSLPGWTLPPITITSQ